MERPWRTICTVCTINHPEPARNLEIVNGEFSYRVDRLPRTVLGRSLWLYGYRDPQAPFFIGTIDHARCRAYENNRGWILCGTVLAHEPPRLDLPGLTMPYPLLQNVGNYSMAPAPTDAALILNGFPSMAQTVAQITNNAMIHPRPFVFEEVADYLRQRIVSSRERHRAWYGAIAIDKHSGDVVTSLHALSQHLCTREITFIFTRGFVGQIRCARPGCYNIATERCHGPNSSRPVMFLQAWQRVEPLHDRYVPLLDIMLEFLRMHLAPESEFSFLCHVCHRTTANN